MKSLGFLIRLMGYVVRFTYELILASFQVAKLVLSPRLNFKSAAIQYKSSMKTQLELILITNSITLTPGTLVMDADLKSGTVLVHVLSAESPDQIRHDLIRFPEKKVLFTTRGTTAS